MGKGNYPAAALSSLLAHLKGSGVGRAEKHLGSSQSRNCELLIIGLHRITGHVPFSPHLTITSLKACVPEFLLPGTSRLAFDKKKHKVCQKAKKCEKIEQASEPDSDMAGMRLIIRPIIMRSGI